MATDACFVYLYDEARGLLELRATHGARFDDPAHRPRMRPGEGITGAAAAIGRPVMIAARGPPRPALRVVPQPARGRVRVDPGRARAGPRPAWRARSTCARGVPRAFADDEVALLSAIAGQVGQAIENAKLYERLAAARGRAGGAGRDPRCSSLYLDDVLRDILAARAGAARRSARSCSTETAAVAYRSGRADDAELIAIARAPFAAETAAAEPLRGSSAGSGRSSFCDAPHVGAEEPRCSHRRPPARRVERPVGAARPARPGDPPPRQEQPADGRLAAAPAAGRPATAAAKALARASTASARSPRCTTC